MRQNFIRSKSEQKLSRDSSQALSDFDGSMKKTFYFILVVILKEVTCFNGWKCHTEVSDAKWYSFLNKLNLRYSVLKVMLTCLFFKIKDLNIIETLFYRTTTIRYDFSLTWNIKKRGRGGIYFYKKLSAAWKKVSQKYLRWGCCLSLEKIVFLLYFERPIFRSPIRVCQITKRQEYQARGVPN